MILAECYLGWVTWLDATYDDIACTESINPIGSNFTVE